MHLRPNAHNFLIMYCRIT